MLKTEVKDYVYAIYRFLPGQNKSSNIYGAYTTMALALKKAKDANKRFDDEFEYRVEKLPVIGEV